MKEVIFKFKDGSQITLRPHGEGDTYIVNGFNKNTSTDIMYALQKESSMSLEQKCTFILRYF